MERDNWLNIQHSLPELQKFVMDELGEIDTVDYVKYYEIVEKNFYTWECKVFPCCNGDLIYSPVAFVMYYKKFIDSKLVSPINIMRKIKQKYEESCQKKI